MVNLPEKYPAANQTAQARPKLAGGGTFDHVEKLVLHTTETAGWPGYPDFAPHLTYDPWHHVFHQHFPLTKSATTLVDGDSTSVRENRDFCIQIEIVAYCDPAMVKKYGHGIDDIDDEAVQDLAELAAWLTRYGLELRLAAGWLPYPKSYGNTPNRMSGPAYDAFRGILGHEHVSTNVHGDPGAPPWLSRMLTAAKAAAGHTDPTPVPPNTTGKALDMSISKAIPSAKYNGKQPLVPGTKQDVFLGPDNAKTFVIGPSDGVDARAVFEVKDAATGAHVDVPELRAYFVVVSYKKGTTTTDVKATLSTGGDTVLYAGDLDDLKDRTARLRLRLDVPDTCPQGLVIDWVQPSGLVPRREVSVKPLWFTPEAPPAPHPPAPRGWRLLAALVPHNAGVSPQGVVVLDDGDWVSSQGDAHDNLTLTRYSPSGKLEGQLVIPGAGHGDRIRADGQRVGVFVRGVWCLIPWQTGTLGATAAVANYRSTYGMLPYGARSWFQGEITNLDGVAIRLYGVPFRGYGPSVVDGVKRPNIPAQLEFYRGSSGNAYHVERLPQLGRDAHGDPYGDRLEPEGLSVGKVDGQTALIVGIVGGRAGHGGFTHRVYGRDWNGPPD